MLEILKNRAIIKICGSDSQKFLQGITTNDIINQTYSYNYLLTNQGRYVFDFFVYKNSVDEFLIDIESAYTSQFIKHISLYKLRSHVEVTDLSGEYNIIYSKDKLQGAEFSFQDPRYSKLGFRSMITIEKISSLDDVCENLYLVDKYKYAIIDGYSDLIQEKSIPIEYGAEELNAISYNKGCYIGQEVISRAKYQGVVRKKIFKVKFEDKSPCIISQAIVTDLESAPLGTVCSAYHGLAIILLKEELYNKLETKKCIANACLGDILVPKWRQTGELSDVDNM